jgi:hypothetical protein
MGRITVRQRVLPLGQRLAKFGEAEPVSKGPFTITAIRSGGVDLLRQDEVRDYFAAAQFFQLSDAEKLSRPSFEQYLCGAVAEVGGIEGAPDFGGFFTPSPVEYEQKIVDAQIATPLEDTYTLAANVLSVLATLGAAGQAALRQSGAAAFLGPDRQVTVDDGRFAVVDPATLKSADTQTYSTYIEARTALQARGQDDRRVVGAHEIA